MTIMIFLGVIESAIVESILTERKYAHFSKCIAIYTEPS